MPIHSLSATDILQNLEILLKKQLPTAGVRLWKSFFKLFTTFIQLRLNCSMENRPNPGLVTIATHMFDGQLKELCSHYLVPLLVHKMLL